MKLISKSYIVSKIMNIGAVRAYVEDASVRHSVFLLRTLISGVMYSARFPERIERFEMLP